MLALLGSSRSDVAAGVEHPLRPRPCALLASPPKRRACRGVPLWPQGSCARPERVLGPRSPGMPYGLAPIPGAWPLAALFQLSPFCLLAATSSSERLLCGFYPLFFTKFLFFL